MEICNYHKTRNKRCKSKHKLKECSVCRKKNCEKYTERCSFCGRFTCGADCTWNGLDIHCDNYPCKKCPVLLNSRICETCLKPSNPGAILTMEIKCTKCSKIICLECTHKCVKCNYRFCGDCTVRENAVKIRKFDGYIFCICKKCN